MLHAQHKHRDANASLAALAAHDGYFLAVERNARMGSDISLRSQQEIEMADSGALALKLASV